jgi:hypothetical protein
VIAAALAVAGIVRIGVFGLFHPGELVVRSAPDRAVVVEDGAERVVLEGRQTLRAKAAGGGDGTAVG